MNKNTKEYIEYLLWEFDLEDIDEKDRDSAIDNLDIEDFEKEQLYIIKELKQMDNPYLIHYFMSEYNFDDGFDIPICVAENKHTDMGTLLEYFKLEEGYVYLFDKYKFLEQVRNASVYSKEILQKRLVFIEKSYERLVNDDFIHKNILFKPYKETEIDFMKKKGHFDNIHPNFIYGCNGKEFNESLLPTLNEKKVFKVDTD